MMFQETGSCLRLLVWLAVAAAAAAPALGDVLFEASFEGGVAPKVAAEGTKATVAGEPRFVEGVRGKAVVLQMSRDRLEYPCAGNMRADEGSLSLWVKPLNYDCVEQRGFKVFWQVGYLDWCLYHYQNHYMLALIGGGSTPPGINFYARPTRDAWSHYVLTWDRRTGVTTVYHNGRKAASQERLPPPEKLPASFCIGPASKWATPDGPFETAFDECRLCDRALDGGSLRSFPFEERRRRRVYQFDRSRGVAGFPQKPEDVLKGWEFGPTGRA